MEGTDTIVRAAIHPGIGIARVGDSPDAFFVGPEVLNPVPPPDGYRDREGFLKRQAARFRIFGYDVQNRPVKELTCDDAMKGGYPVTGHIRLSGWRRKGRKGTCRSLRTSPF
jgi:hypothetical protein